jgi:formylglycine-generating enzyme required for sulfatase activity
VGLLDLIPSEISTGDRLDFGVTPLTADRKLETSRQRAVESGEQIERAVQELTIERARQARRRGLVLRLAALAGLVILAVGIINYQATQQAAATATAVAQQAAATATTVAIANATATQQAAPTATAVAQANATATAIAQRAATAVAQGKPIPQPRGNDGARMVYVPEGEFEMGSNNGDDDEKPVHRIFLDAFWIDVFEVTNALYKKCVDAGRCQPPGNSSSYTRSSYFGNSQFDNYPVIYVSWDDAHAYCTWAGKRLPTEAQWEKAARGTDGRIYPWGNTFDKNLLNSNEGGKGDTTAVGSYPGGASPYGALDMAGNVWEWVADWYDNGYYANSPRQNPTGPSSGESRVLRGGSWNHFQNLARAAYRYDYGHPTNRYNDFGFRCAQ